MPEVSLRPGNSSQPRAFYAAVTLRGGFSTRGPPQQQPYAAFSRRQRSCRRVLGLRTEPTLPAEGVSNKIRSRTWPTRPVEGPTRERSEDVALPDSTALSAPQVR